MGCIVDPELIWKPWNHQSQPKIHLRYPQSIMTESQHHPILGIPPDLFTQWCDNISLDYLTKVSKA
jgi:hypothetical protein